MKTLEQRLEPITKVEHVWCGSEDRWIYIEYNAQNKIVGLNFMQGDEYKEFKEDWCVSNENLVRLYNTLKKEFKETKKATTKIEFINKCFWIYLECIIEI